MSAPTTRCTGSPAPLECTRAAVWRGGSTITLEDIQVPDLGPGEVLVRVLLATVCGSDRHTVSGRRDAPCPSILGHETVGEIVTLGEAGATTIDGRPLRLGDRVVWSVTLPCWDCDRCRAGITAKCRNLRKAGHEALQSSWALSGGYAEHVLLPAGMPIAVADDTIPNSLAAPAACATATVMAAVERAGELRGKRVTIIGAGMLGLTAAAVAADRGAQSVIAVDPSSERRELARDFGATDVHATTANAGACDVLLEFSGSTAALQEGLTALDVQGTAVLAGTVLPGAPVALDAESVVRRQLSIVGSHNYEPRHLVDALDFLASTFDHFAWTELIAPPRPLEAIHDLLTGAPGPLPRYAITPR